jgi:hypothetical protein
MVGRPSSLGFRNSWRDPWSLSRSDFSKSEYHQPWNAIRQGLLAETKRSLSGASSGRLAATDHLTRGFADGARWNAPLGTQLPSSLFVYPLYQPWSDIRQGGRKVTVPRWFRGRLGFTGPVRAPESDHEKRRTEAASPTRLARKMGMPSLPRDIT